MSLTTSYASLQILASVIHLIGASVLGYCLSRRTPPLNRWEPWKHLTWGKTCIILVLLDSWIFVVFSGILSTGVGLIGSITTCQIAIILCILCYGSTKLFIYAFLVEKVYIVWSSGNQTPRFQTPVYRICCTVQLGYLVIFFLMIFGRKSFMNEDRVCVLGLESFATIPLVAYDLSQNVLFTGMFLWPFWRSHPMSPKLRAMAKKTLYAACGSLTVSAVNYVVIIALHGQEIGWICLVSCVTDVTLNALLLFWVSSGSSRSGECCDRFSLPQMDMTALTFPDFPDSEVTTIATASASISPTVRAANAISTTTTTTTTTIAVTARATMLRNTVPPSQKSPTLIKFPDEMFDYIPRDHRDPLGDEESDAVEIIVVGDSDDDDADTLRPVPVGRDLDVEASQSPRRIEDSIRNTRS
ncbi:hypothetical protein E1B28_000041 [Marasmius oreades]|uniref:Transmembrane protein n=1 Tax=Marasmius oreades TaxID=181124 RepID=A0A9P8ADX6_9AGAR|nr:uncharacterized protein E1B28_000041 [Marasmius oreades]KAG7098067.1 hypothetical protein E1B28_000041 [Marasmius oreades]